MPADGPRVDLPTAEGSCHCARVKFYVRTNKRELLRCNCSICSKRGYLHLIVEASEFTLVCGQSELSEYRFGTGVARHYFCKHCGITPFYVPRSHPQGYSVNFRCVDDYQERLADYHLRDFEGDRWDEHIDEIR